MRKKITKSFFTLLVLSLFTGSAIGQVNMDRYITFDAASFGYMSLKADNENTPVKIIRGGGLRRDYCWYRMESHLF